MRKKVTKGMQSPKMRDRNRAMEISKDRASKRGGWGELGDSQVNTTMWQIVGSCCIAQGASSELCNDPGRRAAVVG